MKLRAWAEGLTQSGLLIIAIVASSYAGVFLGSKNAAAVRTDLGALAALVCAACIVLLWRLSAPWDRWKRLSLLLTVSVACFLIALVLQPVFESAEAAARSRHVFYR